MTSLRLGYLFRYLAFFTDGRIEQMTDGNNSGLLVRSLVCCLLLGIAIVAMMFFWRFNAERNAMNFVRLNGYTNEGYAHNSWSASIEHSLPPSSDKPYLVEPLIGVAFPRDRMTDRMAKHLLNIPNLDNIRLYPADPNGAGFDGAAIEINSVTSLNDLELPLSGRSINKLEERFPNIRIYTADLPPVRISNDTITPN
jgi:hypothetical protein